MDNQINEVIFQHVQPNLNDYKSNKFTLSVIDNLKTVIKELKSLEKKGYRIIGSGQPQELLYRLTFFLKINPETAEIQPGLGIGLDSSWKEILGMSVSVRTYNSIEKEGNIETIRELVQNTESQILKIKGIGKKSLKELKETLATFGLSFGVKLSPE